MREIKFRAWGKEEMDGNPVHTGTSTCAVGINQLPHMFEVKGVVLMQYTGLKDKNGVEIYEGDIVNIFGSNTEIEFYEGCFGYWIWKEEKYRNFITATISDKEEIEVIGNIYENKDIL